MVKEGFQGLSGIALCVVLLWTACVGSLGLLFPSLGLLILPFEWSRRAYRWWSTLVAKHWFSLATLLLEKWAGVKVVVSGDLPSSPGEPAMIICNHRTRIDWMFLWCLCERLGILESMKITLKQSLKSLPGFGWAMQSFLFVFLAREKSRDLQHMQDVMDYHTRNSHPLSLILFPEGTDLSPSNLIASNAYAVQKGLPKYRHVLHPKVVGWSRSVSHLRHSCMSIYDITIAYHDFVQGERPSELSVVTGRFPKEVHMHVERFSMSSLPEAPAALENWCRSRFLIKEKRLQSFYSGGSNRFGEEAVCPVGKAEMYADWGRALVFWGVSSVVSWFSLVILVGWLWTLAAIGAWILITRWGGVDSMELMLHGRKGIYKKKLVWPGGKRLKG